MTNRFKELIEQVDQEDCAEIIARGQAAVKSMWENHETGANNNRNIADLKGAIIALEARVEMTKTCSGCIHMPKCGDPYPMVCGECSRWYSDRYEGGAE